MSGSRCNNNKKRKKDIEKLNLQFLFSKVSKLSKTFLCIRNFDFFLLICFIYRSLYFVNFIYFCIIKFLLHYFKQSIALFINVFFKILPNRNKIVVLSVVSFQVGSYIVNCILFE